MIYQIGIRKHMATSESLSQKKNRFDCYQSFTKMCHPADRPSADACNCSHLQYFFPHAESAVGARSCGACIPPASAHL